MSRRKPPTDSPDLTSEMMEQDSDPGSEETLGSGTTESEVDCPYCGEPISVLVDLGTDSQQYIEDCSVCCRPIRFSVRVEDGELSSLEADRD